MPDVLILFPNQTIRFGLEITATPFQTNDLVLKDVFDEAII